VRSAQKPRCLWPKRDCYPPPNLWYRITVGFDGVLYFAFRPPKHGITHCFPCWERTIELEWKIRSNSAVRLRLMCDDLSDSAGPFLVKRRINGERKPIAGCARGARNVRPSLMFAANGQGEVTRWKNTLVADPSETEFIWVRRLPGDLGRTPAGPLRDDRPPIVSIWISGRGTCAGAASRGRRSEDRPPRAAPQAARSCASRRAR
jgi:hypothetical protein